MQFGRVLAHVVADPQHVGDVAAGSLDVNAPECAVGDRVQRGQLLRRRREDLPVSDVCTLVIPVCVGPGVDLLALFGVEQRRAQIDDGDVGGPPQIGGQLFEPVLPDEGDEWRTACARGR